MGHAGTTATIEVAVRFAGDLVEIARVPAGSTVTVGTRALVACAGAEHTIDLVTVSMTAVTVSKDDRVPRRRVDVRPYIYGAASLATQVALVVTAMLLATETITAPVVEVPRGHDTGGVRIKQFSTDAQTVAKKRE